MSASAYVLHGYVYDLTRDAEVPKKYNEDRNKQRNTL